MHPIKTVVEVKEKADTDFDDGDSDSGYDAGGFPTGFDGGRLTGSVSCFRVAPLLDSVVVVSTDR